MQRLRDKERRRRDACLSYTTLGEYVQEFTWPKGSPDVKGLFDAASSKKYYKNCAFSCTASEMLTLIPVLACFFTRVVAPLNVCGAEVTSFLMCITVVEMLQLARQGRVGPSQMMVAIRSHLDAFLRAYGADKWRPKHHYSIHLPSMMKLHGFLLSCFCHERKHRLVKRFAKHRANTTSFEIGTLEDVTIQQLHDVARRWGAAVPSKPSKRQLKVLFEVFGASDVVIANEVPSKHGAISVGDVVYYSVDGGCECGTVLAHACCASVWYSVAQRWGKEEDGPTTSEYTDSKSPPLLLAPAPAESVL